MSKDKIINTEFNLIEDLIHVNHAAVAPWPKRTQVAVSQFADENAAQGSLNYPTWLEQEHELRKQCQRLINAESTDEIALLKSTSEALSVVAYGLDWQAGDSVVTSAEEFPSNRLLWQSLKQFGVEVRLVDYKNNDDAEQMIIDACDKSTKLLSISAVQFSSGRRMQLQKLGEYCKAQSILFCVDAIQQLGALEFDVKKIHADFVAADGHKWMLGAEGLALFYCRQQHIDKLKLNQYGWHMVEKHHDFSASDWQPANSARRFECGSPNMLGIMALSASLSLLEEIGMAEVEKRILDNTNYLINELSALPNIEILSSVSPEQRAGIVTFKHTKLDNQVVFDYLQQQHVFAAQRGGGIRLSPHFYTQRQQLEQLVTLIKQAD